MKLKIHHNLLLTACVLALVIACVASVWAPVRFSSEQKKRETAVKERLVAIRQAQERYRAKHGIYCPNLTSLVKAGLIADSTIIIPYSDDERFELGTTTITGKSGRSIALMECGAQYQQYLNGLNENDIANLIEAANEAGRYPGLKIGDLETPNNNAGNWE